MKNKNIILIAIAILVILTALFLVFRGKAEDQTVIQKALILYEQKKAEGMNFSSQCLGTVDGYAVDIVHVPRSEEDDKLENQCDDYRENKVSHFIELDKNGNIVRIG